MNYRKFGKTGFNISEVSLGTWQLGGKWGLPFSQQDAEATLAEAYEQGVNFFDTADGYQNGASERAVANLLRPIRMFISPPKLAVRKNP